MKECPKETSFPNFWVEVLFVLPCSYFHGQKISAGKAKTRRAGHHTMWSLQSKEKMEKKEFPGDSKVIWPFQGVKWPPTRDDKGTLNHLVLIILPNQKLPWKTSRKLLVTDWCSKTVSCLTTKQHNPTLQKGPYCTLSRTIMVWWKLS